MKVSESVTREEQRVSRLERRLSQLKLKARKQETRNKIQLGGLVVKAGLDHYPKDVILGAMLEAVENLKLEPSIKKLFKAKGEAAFMEYKEK